MPVDYLGFANSLRQDGVNLGLAALAQGFEGRRTDERQRREDAMREAEFQQRSDLQRLALATAQRQAAESDRQFSDEQGFRQLMAGKAQPTQFAVPAAPQQGNGLLQLDPSLTEIQPRQEVGIRDQIEYWRSRDPKRAKEIAASALEDVKAIGALDKRAGVERYNQLFGTKMEYVGHDGKFTTVKTEDGKVIAINDANPKDTRIVYEGPGKPRKMVERTVDLGDKVEYIYGDGTREMQKKGITPGQQVKINLGNGQGKAPAGYRWNGDSLEAIPGGPADKKATKPLPATQLSELADQRRILDTLKEIQFIANDGDVTTGPVAGRAQKYASKAGMASDTFKTLNQKIATVNNTMLKLRSGAAVTPQEYDRFLEEMPTVNDQEDVIRTKLTGAIGYAQSLLDTKLDTYAEGGYRIPNNIRPTMASAPDTPAAPVAPSTPPQRKATPAAGPQIRNAEDYMKKIGRGR